MLSGLPSLAGAGGAEAAAEGIGGRVAVPVADLLRLVADGTITDNETLGALLKALVALGLVG